MTPDETFQQIFEADAPLMALLTGGVYTFAELGLQGLVASNPVCADAFSTQNGMSIIQPCMVIRTRTDVPTYTRHDADQQETSHDGSISFWLYQYDDFGSIDAAADLVYGLIHTRVFSGLGLVLRVNALLNQIAPEFENTSLRREDYQFRRIKRT